MRERSIKWIVGNNNDSNNNGYLGRLTSTDRKRLEILWPYKRYIDNKDAMLFPSLSLTHTHTHTCSYIRAIELKKRLSKREGKFERTDRLYDGQKQGVGAW